MISTCREQQIISDAHSLAWLDRDYAQARKLLVRLNDHEKNCPKCQAVANGVGLAGGLFAGAKIGEEVESNG